MRMSFFDALRAPIDRLVEFAAAQCCRRAIPALTVAQSLPLPTRIDRLADWLDRLHSRGTFNGTVLIARRGSILFERHYGFADVDGAVPLSAHSSFALASVSKQFTAMGIMLLARRGKLVLHDRIARYLPELSDYGEVTIRQLLHHTSGVPDYMELADEHWDAENILTNADMIALFERHRPPLDFAPGDRYEYSNTGYALLGEIISRASGTPYAEFMAAEIFQPLGMRDSAAFNLASERCPLRSRVFGMRKRFVCFGKKLFWDLNYLDGVFGDGGIYASARDLVRWDAALRDGTLIAREIYGEAYVSGTLNNGERTGYGFGWEIAPPDRAEHWGEWEGFTTYLGRDLQKQTLLVMLSNLAPAVCVDAITSELKAFVAQV
jgi:CubicO group peptidase (beta-lactamase class C family)